jgi:hypothetical protein
MNNEDNCYYVIKYENKYYNPYVSTDMDFLMEDINNICVPNRQLAIRFPTKELAVQNANADALYRQSNGTNFDKSKMKVVKVIYKVRNVH